MKDKLELELKQKYLPLLLPYSIMMSTKDGIIKTLLSTYVLLKIQRGEILHLYPILRPLSDLTREELAKAGFSCHIDYLTYENKGVEWTLKAPYTHLEYLFSKHYDVFGLIEKGLAISHNEIEK